MMNVSDRLLLLLNSDDFELLENIRTLLHYEAQFESLQRFKLNCVVTF